MAGFGGVGWNTITPHPEKEGVYLLQVEISADAVSGLRRLWHAMPDGMRPRYLADVAGFFLMHLKGVDMPDLTADGPN